MKRVDYTVLTDIKTEPLPVRLFKSKTKTLKNLNYV